MSRIVDERLKEKERRGGRRGGKFRKGERFRSLEIEHVCVLVLSLVCTFLSSVEAMHTLTALLNHLQQNVDGKRRETGRGIISERRKEKPGAFLFRYEYTTWPFLCKIYIDCLAYQCVYTQRPLAVAPAVNVIVPIAMSLL